MSWYYTREPGDEGQILTDEGTPGGVRLSDLLDSGGLPARAALELVAGVADVVSIAEEDQAVHGDLEPGDVYIDATGAVSVSGYGVEKRGCRAPEGRAVGIASDVYGLGIIMHSVMSGAGLGSVPRDRDGHDDHIVDKLLGIDWGELAGRSWMQDVQSFLCSMLAFEPSERPAPLDVANVLFHVAGQAPGTDLRTWAARAVPGAGGQRRLAPAAPVEEDLGGPRELGGPVSSGQAFKVRKAASAKGESTAFWSREKIAAMLAEDDDDDDDASPARGGAREAWSPAAPRRSSPPAPTSPPPPTPPEPMGVAAPPPPTPPTPPRAAPPVPSAPPRAQPAPSVPEPPAPVAPPVAVASAGQADRRPELAPGYTPTAVAGVGNAGGGTPFAVAGGAGPDLSPPAEDRRSGGSLKVVLGVIAGLAVLCLGGGGIVGGAWYYLNKGKDQVEVTASDLAEQAQAVDDKAASDDKEDTGVVEPAAGDADKAAAGDGEPAPSSSKSSSSKSSSSKSSSSKSSSSSSTSGSSTSSSSSKSSSSSSSSKSSSSSGSSGSTRSSSSSGSTRSSGSSSSSSSDATAAAPPAGPFQVRFLVDGEATLQCGDSQQATFAATGRMSFQGITTCRVLMGDAAGVVQLTQEATVRCSVSGDRVSCSSS